MREGVGNAYEKSAIGSTKSVSVDLGTRVSYLGTRMSVDLGTRMSVDLGTRVSVDLGTRGGVDLGIRVSVTLVTRVRS